MRHQVAAQRAYGFPADLWSAGCLFHTLVTGSAPFEQADVKETLQCIVKGEYEDPTGLSDMAVDFLRSLLELDPTKRANAGEMLSHPFLYTPGGAVDVSHVSSVGSSGGACGGEGDSGDGGDDSSIESDGGNHDSLHGNYETSVIGEPLVHQSQQLLQPQPPSQSHLHRPTLTAEPSDFPPF